MPGVLNIAQITGMNAGVINGAVDLALSRISEDTIQFDYGDYIMGGIKSRVTGRVKITPTEEVRMPDNTVMIKLHIQYLSFYRTLINSGHNCYTVRIHIYASQDRSNEIFHFDDNACGTSKDMPTPSFDLQVYIPPRQTVHAGFGRYWNQITSLSHPKEDEFNGGISLYNPLRAGYQPGMQRHGNEWLSHDRVGGQCLYMGPYGRRTVMWTRGGDENQVGDPPSYRTADAWRNMKKIGNLAQP